MSLSETLKEIKTIQTHLGEFEFEKDLGKEGGNSRVFIFKRTCNNISKSYAIKFLKPDVSEQAILRFKDEFFLTQQIPRHKNIAEYYHIDKIKISSEDEYYIIIMKLYFVTLKDIKRNTTFNENSENELKKVFYDLIDGLEHLHNNNFIHRDIKPENILYDKENDCYVITDLGITKFSDDLPKLAETEKSDRMANWSFSPKEQLNSKNPPEKNWDIFALGQVIHWFVTGETIRGSLSNFNIFGNYNSDFCDIIKQFIKKSTDNDPKNRFQSIQEVRDFISQKEKRLNEIKIEKSFWECFNNFDNIIRKNFPKINNIDETSDTSKINRFISDFNSLLSEYDNHFYFMELNGNNNYYKQQIIDISNNLKLFYGCIEIDIEKIVIYRNRNNNTRNFFILITRPMQKFSSDSSNIDDISSARYWIEKNAYLSCADTNNGYYENYGETIQINDKDFPYRERYYKRYAFMIGFNQTPISRTGASDEFIPKILQMAIDGSLNVKIINEFERATYDDFADFIKKWR